jgi:hypothetical protein
MNSGKHMLALRFSGFDPKATCGATSDSWFGGLVVQREFADECGLSNIAGE